MIDISVIVCTRNRAGGLADCLDAIASAIDAAAPSLAEIVIVNNGSQDETAAIVHAWSCAHPVRLILVDEPVKGLSRARNTGIKAASGAWLAFTDDDCRLEAGYIRQLLVHARGDTGPVLRGGRVLRGNPEDIDFTTLDVAERRVCDPKIAGPTSVLHWILGCNMAISRQAAIEVGLFDERFGAGGKFKAADDSDFMIRCHLRGIPIEYVPDMLVYHHHGRNTTLQIEALLAGYDESEGALYAKHLQRYPQFARQFWWDCRNAVKEWFGGAMHIPALHYSHSTKVAANLRGMSSYCRSLWDNP